VHSFGVHGKTGFRKCPLSLLNSGQDCWVNSATAAASRLPSTSSRFLRRLVASATNLEFTLDLGNARRCGDFLKYFNVNGIGWRGDKLKSLKKLYLNSQTTP
jgi:hypothetical protein